MIFLNLTNFTLYFSLAINIIFFQLLFSMIIYSICYFFSSINADEFIPCLSPQHLNLFAIKNIFIQY